MSHIIVQTSVEKAPSKSIRCSEKGGGGGRRSAERTFRQPWMHYLPPGVFYDFLGSHNKVRQRQFRTMVLRNRSRRLLSLVGDPLSRSLTSSRRRPRHCLRASSIVPRRPAPSRAVNTAGGHQILCADYTQ